MTKAPTPDRIWANSESLPTDDDWDYCSTEDDFDAEGVPYLLSTPAREAAEELLKALELLTGHAAFDDPQYLSLQLNERLDKARAAITKAKG